MGHRLIKSSPFSWQKCPLPAFYWLEVYGIRLILDRKMNYLIGQMVELQLDYLESLRERKLEHNPFFDQSQHTAENGFKYICIIHLISLNQLNDAVDRLRSASPHKSCRPE